MPHWLCTSVARPPSGVRSIVTGRVAPAIVSSPPSAVPRNSIGELPSTFWSMFLRISRRSRSDSGFAPRSPSRISSERGSAFSSTAPSSPIFALQRPTTMTRS